MKKLIFLLLLLPSLSWGQETMVARMNPHYLGAGTVAAGSPVFCTGTTTCTPTTPGNCELACEDWEGPRWTWTDVTTGGTVSHTTAAPAGFTCADKGSYVMEVARTSDASILSYIDTTNTTGPWYAEFYIIFTSLDGSVANYTVIPFFQLCGATGMNSSAISLGAYHYTGTDFRWRLSINVTASPYISGSNTLTTDTLYRVAISYALGDPNESGSVTVTKVSDSSTVASGSLSDGTGDRTGRYPTFGNSATTANVDFTIQVDNFALSATGAPGACN